MSFPLFKFFIKNNWRLWLIMALVSSFYLGAIALMATDPMIISALDFLNMALQIGAIAEAEAAAMVTVALGYGFACVVITMIYYILISNILVNKAVDNNSLSAHLSLNISRKKYITTAAVFLCVSVFALYLVLFFVGLLCLSKYEGSFDVGNFISANLTVCLCAVMAAMLSFACSAGFSGTRLGMSLLAGVPVAFALFLVMSMYIEPLKWLTPFGWFNASEIYTGAASLWWLFPVVFIAISAAAYVATLKIFNRKQIPKNKLT
jgi:hypothetical protein